MEYPVGNYEFGDRILNEAGDRPFKWSCTVARVESGIRDQSLGRLGDGQCVS